MGQPLTQTCGIGVEEAAASPPPRTALADVFGIDLRSLALLRVSLALLLVADLITRSADLGAHYTDWGLLPRAPLSEQFLAAWNWSLHLLSGQVQVQAAIFLLAGFIALLLLVGFHTRLATVASWVLLVSLHNRNPMVLDGGDVLLRMLLFWSMFLPLGACWSVDAAMNTRPPQSSRFLSIASAALLIQVALVYWFSVMHKMHPIWLDGRALGYALHIDHFATPLGKWLLGFPSLLKLLTHAALALEFAGPIFAFLPVVTVPVRIVVILSFWLLHAGMGATLELGHFPYICAAAWVAFIPGALWDKLATRLRTPRRAKLTIYYDGECGFCRKGVMLLRTFFLLGETSVRPAQESAPIEQVMKEQNSWVVEDDAGVRHVKFGAFIAICRASPLVWPVAPLLSRGPLKWAGDRAYKWVSENRSRAGRLTAPLRFAPLRLRSSRLGNLVAGAVLVYVVAWNILTLYPAGWQTLWPAQLDVVAQLTRVDQSWQLFAPYPMSDDGWFVIPGKLRDGSEINVLDGHAVTWEKPPLISAMYSNTRWRKYMVNLWLAENAPHRLYFGRYLCRRWSERHVGGKELMTFQICYMREDTQDDGVTPPQKVVLWDHDCFAR